MNFDKSTKESTSDTIVRIKRPVKLILISLSILIAVILVITITFSIIFALGESTISPATCDNTTTSDFSSCFNLHHSVKLNLSCTIPDAPNEKYPEKIKTFEELAEPAMRKLNNATAVFFSRTILTIKNSSTVHVNKQIKNLVNRLLDTKKQKEGNDFWQTWTLGTKSEEVHEIFFDAPESVEVESVPCTKNNSKLSSPVRCLISRNSLPNNMIEFFRSLFGTTRLNGTVSFGYDQPWRTFELNAKSQTDGEPVGKNIQKFNEDEIGMCKCLENNNDIDIYGLAQQLQTCFKTLKIREIAQAIIIKQ